MGQVHGHASCIALGRHARVHFSAHIRPCSFARGSAPRGERLISAVPRTSTDITRLARRNRTEIRGVACLQFRISISTAATGESERSRSSRGVRGVLASRVFLPPSRVSKGTGSQLADLGHRRSPLDREQESGCRFTSGHDFRSELPTERIENKRGRVAPSLFRRGRRVLGKGLARDETDYDHALHGKAAPRRQLAMERLSRSTSNYRGALG